MIDPLKLFASWFRDARKISHAEPNAMVLSTVTKQGKPRSRFVLLKDHDSKGFYFFSNQKSDKGAELHENPYASLLFYWPELHRQVRIEGKVKKISADIVEEYFHSRPRGSQLAAFISAQSATLRSRNTLIKAFRAAEKKFAHKAIPVPKHWGGYLLEPTYFEFWSGMPSRLHDRVAFEKARTLWRRKRLYP